MTTERSDAELLKDCEHQLTQLVIKEELRSGRSDNIVIQICQTLREVAARLTQPSVDPISDIESPRLLTQEEVEELESLPVRPYPPRRIPAAPSAEEVIEAARKNWPYNTFTFSVVFGPQAATPWYITDASSRCVVASAPTLAQLLEQLRNDDG